MELLSIMSMQAQKMLRSFSRLHMLMLVFRFLFLTCHCLQIFIDHWVRSHLLLRTYSRIQRGRWRGCSPRLNLLNYSTFRINLHNCLFFFSQVQVWFFKALLKHLKLWLYYLRSLMLYGPFRGLSGLESIYERLLLDYTTVYLHLRWKYNGGWFWFQEAQKLLWAR